MTTYFKNIISYCKVDYAKKLSFYGIDVSLFM